MRPKKAYQDHVDEMKEIHKNFYTYPEYVFLSKGVSTKIPITCLEHGEFMQSINSHKKGTRCPKCAKEKKEVKPKLTKNRFLMKANIKFGNQYAYPNLSLPIGGKTKISIYHRVCKQSYEVLASTHISDSNKGGCKKCNFMAKNSYYAL